MIKIRVNTIWICFFAILAGSLFTACSERRGDPVVLSDSTIVYPPKDTNDISAKITFSRNYGQKSGRQWAVTTTFPLMTGENIYAVVDLKNRFNNFDHSQMLHLDWIGPDGKSFYLKRIDLLPGDSTTALESSISVEADKRPAGDYMLQVYLFRELIAEKHFYLLPEEELKKISADIVFFKNIDKETGIMNGIDTVFEVKEKGILRAQVKLSGINIYQDEELPFRLEWTGKDGESFYTKKAEIKPSDTTSILNASISITPDKREPGECFLKVYLFDEMIGEKRFVLKPEEKINHKGTKVTKKH